MTVSPSAAEELGEPPSEPVAEPHALNPLVDPKIGQ